MQMVTKFQSHSQFTLEKINNEKRVMIEYVESPCSEQIAVFIANDESKIFDVLTGKPLSNQKIKKKGYQIFIDELKIVSEGVYQGYVSSSKFQIYDYIKIDDFISKNISITNIEMREILEDLCIHGKCKQCILVDSDIIPVDEVESYLGNYDAIIKPTKAKYSFGLNPYSFIYLHKIELLTKVLSFEEGPQGKSYAIHVEFNNERFTVEDFDCFDEQRENIWINRSDYRNNQAIIEFECSLTGKLNAKKLKGWKV